MRVSGPTETQQMGISNPDVVYYIRWRSSRPVQLAFSRMKQLGFLRSQLELPPTLKEKYYVIEVNESLFPINEYTPEIHSVFQGLGATQFSQIEDSVYLIKRNGEKIALSDYLPPQNAEGREIGGLFLFLRKNDKGQAVIVPADGEIRFVAGLLNRVRLSEKFKLKDMLFEGVLEL